MTLIEETREKMQEIMAERRDDSELARMWEFYNKMKSYGIAIKHQYNLPPISMSDVSVHGQQGPATTSTVEPEGIH